MQHMIERWCCLCCRYLCKWSQLHARYNTWVLRELLSPAAQRLADAYEKAHPIDDSDGDDGVGELPPTGTEQEQNPHKRLRPTNSSNSSSTASPEFGAALRHCLSVLASDRRAHE